MLSTWPTCLCGSLAPTWLCRFRGFSRDLRILLSRTGIYHMLFFRSRSGAFVSCLSLIQKWCTGEKWRWRTSGEIWLSLLPSKSGRWVFCHQCQLRASDLGDFPHGINVPMVIRSDMEVWLPLEAFSYTMLSFDRVCCRVSSIMSILSAKNYSLCWFTRL